MPDCVRTPAVTGKGVAELVNDVNTIREQRRQVQAIIDRMVEQEREIIEAITATPAATVDEAEMKLNLQVRRGDIHRLLNRSAARDLRRLAGGMGHGE